MPDWDLLWHLFFPVLGRFRRLDTALVQVLNDRYFFIM